MKLSLQLFVYASALICAGCASPPSFNATANSHNACIQDCAPRASTTATSLQQSTIDKLNKLDEFLNGVK